MPAWARELPGTVGRHENRPISLRTHATAEPLVGVLFLVAPWLFGFSDVTSATTVSIVLGVLVLLTGMTTRWRFAVVRLLPLQAHRMSDFAIGAVAILAPFVFGFSNQGGPTRWLIIIGVAEIAVALMTRWDTRDE